MRIKTIVAFIILLVIMGGIGWIGYKKLFYTPPTILFKTQKPEKRDISKIVRAEGSLEAQGTSKLGPLITATVKKLHVGEGQKVAKGTLLVELENTTGGDLDVRRTKAVLESSKAVLSSTTAVFKRDQALFKAGQLSQENFEKSTTDYEKAVADVKANQAAYEKEVFLFDQIRVRAPHEGTVVSIKVKEGETVTTMSPPTVLLELAKDLSVMKAKLDIDEGKIGDIRLGMQTEITVDTYPYKPPWTGPIDFIGQGAEKKSDQTNQVTYNAWVLINNDEGLLRQGMSVHAKTIIAEVKQALAVPGFVFQLNNKVLEEAAKTSKYGFKPMDADKKTQLLRQKSKNPIKFLWIVEGKTFVEKSVEIGITDNAFFQILSGITANDDVVADDMTASEEIKKLAKQFA